MREKLSYTDSVYLLNSYFFSPNMASKRLVNIRVKKKRLVNIILLKIK
jgi:hypothetical protein